ncbi:unnamed protein product [Danaus chrysippus]|uniref:(African queen) hypothetical protein n=1 Tax=Danaus chrysippus TaxID=151541 RepID=A0A8J2QV22_9NEOP|nr:unnamed protein product [Danaus chrysippus]
MLRPSHTQRDGKERKTFRANILYVSRHCQQKDLDYGAWSRPRGAMAIKQGYEAKMSTGDGTVHQKTDDRLGHHQSMSQMLYGAGLGPGRSGSSSSSPVGGTNTGSGLLVVPQPLGKGPTKLQPLHSHARKYHCKMCPQIRLKFV